MTGIKDPTDKSDLKTTKLSKYIWHLMRKKNSQELTYVSSSNKLLNRKSKFVNKYCHINTIIKQHSMNLLFLKLEVNKKQGD